MRILILLVALALPSVARAELKLAYVDLQRAVDQSNEGKQSKARLQAEFDKRQRDLDVQLEDLKRLLQENPGKPELLERELSLEKRGQKLQHELDDKQQAEAARLFKKLRQVAAQVAQARKIEWVLDASSVLVAPSQPGTDLTDEVIKRANEAK